MSTTQELALYSHIKCASSSLISISSTILLVILSYEMHQTYREQSNNLTKTIVYSSFGLLLSNSIGYAINAIGVELYHNWEDENTLETILLSIFGLCEFIMILSIYIFSKSLLIFSFKDSALAISKKVQLAHILNLITIIIFAMSSIISRYLFDSRPTAYILGALYVIIFNGFNSFCLL